MTNRSLRSMSAGTRGGIILILLSGLSFSTPFVMVVLGLGELAWALAWIFQFAIAPSLLIWGVAKLMGRA
jgi:hypothetical protein